MGSKLPQAVSLRLGLQLQSICATPCNNFHMADSDVPRPSASETPKAAARPITPLKSALTTPPAAEIKTLCERCGEEMYRMHAVWRCPACGFKTDCCGW